MKTNKYIIIILIFLFGSCSSWKVILISEGNQNDAVQNAIHDFIRTSKISKKDSVYSIDIKNISDEILGISIIGVDNKLFPTTDNRIGSNNPYFPTQYILQENKLFYWYDSTCYITDDLIKVLSKYKQIDSLNVHGFIGIPEMIIDDSKVGVDYYFCKRNLLKYKKITTSIAMGSYKPPKLKCK